MRNIAFLTVLTLSALVISTKGAELVGDNYNVTGSGSGFALGSGVNSGINPPTTRLTGSAAAGLRYIKTAGTKVDSAHTITNNNRFQIARIGNSSTISFSSGTGPYDFGTVLNTLAATPALPAVYDLKIDIANAAAAAERCSFAISSAAGTANQWDFGIQLFRTATTDVGYTVRKRASIASSGLGAAMNLDMAYNVGTYSNAVSFVLRVTDAGAEAAPSTNSYIQVSVDGGTNWIYDTRTDLDLPAGWCFAGASRFIYFDAAPNAGPVTYDNFSLDFISGPTAGPRTWTGGGANDNWSTSGNWGGVAPVTGDTLIFNGTTRQANINDIVDLIVPSVTFNNGGFSLSGNSFSVSGLITNKAGINTFAGDLAWSSGAVKSWGITSGSEVVLNNITTVEVNGDHSLNGGGALRLKGTMNIGQVLNTVIPAFIINAGQHIVDGGTFNSRGGYRIGSLATGAGGKTILTNGANFTLTVAGGNLRVGDSANPNASSLEINNSSLTMTGGNFGIPYAANATGIVAQIGSTVSGGIVAFNDNGAGHGTYTIQNGVLEALQIREDFTNGFSSISFDNAILRTAVGANTAFFSGVDLATIQSGGLAIDANLDVTIAQPLSGTGSLTKSNSAAVILTGANTYSGNTLVQAGKLSLPTVQTNATAVQVADGAELGVNARSLGSTLSVSSLNFAGASSSILSFDLGTFTTPTAPLANVSSLSVNGPVTIRVANGLQLTTGQFVLVDYDGTISGGFQFSLGSLPAGVSATLVNNTANSSIDLNITSVPGFVWTGATSDNWDTGTQNWISKENGLPSTYSDGFPTEFFDGASNGIVTLAINPSPSSLTVSNDSLPYVWNNGTITTPLLKKFGPGSVTRAGGDSDLINALELNAGSYIVSPSADAAFATVLSDIGVGTGTFAKQGANTLTMSTNNASYDGAILVQQGTLKLGTTNSPLGSTNGATTIANGATLDLNDIVAPHEPVFVSGSGVGGLGAIIDSTAGGGVANNLTDVTLVGHTTVGSPNGGRWDLRVRSGTGPGPGLRGNGFDLTKVGSGSVSIASQRNIGVNTPYWEMNLGDVFINQGSLTFAESLSLGNPSKTITIAAGASLGTFDLNATNPIVRTVLMTDATITSGGGTGDTNMFTGAFQFTGANHLRPNDTRMIINGAIGGTGSLNVSAANSGILFLNGVNTFPGDTTVTNGVLSGFGSIAGNLVMLGGTLAPGSGVGTFTVNANATLAGATLMELNRSQSPNSDRLVVGGTLTKSGALTVVLGAGAPPPQAGDVYQLFNKGGSGSFAPITLPDLSALPGGLAWDTSNLDVNGSITVTGAATPPTISNVSANGGNFVFSGTGGIEGSDYVVLASTNIATPVSNWTALATNVFGSGGSFGYTNVINPATPQTFFLLRVP